MQRSASTWMAVGLLASAAAVSVPAAAADGKVAVGVSAGTLGVGPELSFRFAEHAGVRVGGGFFDYDHDDTLDDIDYDAKLKLKSFGAMLDWYPTGGSFRLSVGARSNGNQIDLLGTPSTSVEIGNVTYAPAQVGTLSGTIKSKDFAPIASLGFGGKAKEGFTVGFELGVMAQGSPRIRNLTATGLLANDPAFRTQLANEQREIEDDADDFKLWPIVELKLLYRF